MPGVTVRIGQRREHDRRVPESAARHIESDTQNRPGACDLERVDDGLDAVWETRVIEQDAHASRVRDAAREDFKGVARS